MLAVAATVVGIIYFTTRDHSSRPSLVVAALAAVQEPTPNEFPTPDSAIRYLVEQVRAQNVDGATRVLPIAYYDSRITLQRYLSWTTFMPPPANAFLPNQPFSKLYFELGLLEQNFNDFAASLLDPKDSPHDLHIFNTEQAAQQIQARLDPSRLARIYVQSVKSEPGTHAKVGKLRSIGVDRLVSVRVVIGGMGTPRPYDVSFERFGTNWLIASINRSPA